MKFDQLSVYLNKIEKESSRLTMTEILSELFKEIDGKEVSPIINIIRGEIMPAHKGIDLGVGEKFILQAISISSGYSVNDVTNTYKKSGDLGITSQKLMETKKQQSFFSTELSVLQVYDKLVKLAVTGGGGSQNSKIKAVSELLISLSPLSSKYVSRFVNGTLRLGVGMSTIIDGLSYYKCDDKSLHDEIERAYNMCSDLGYVGELVITDYDKIKEFGPTPLFPIRPALAERMKTGQDIYDKLGNCFIDSKYDGFRLQIHKKNDKVEVYSRKGEIMTHMFPDIVTEILNLKQNNLIIDSEVLAYNKKTDKFYPFQVTIKRKRKHDIHKVKGELPVKCLVFDVLCVNGDDLTFHSFKERRKIIEQLFSDTINCHPSDGVYVTSGKEITDYFQSRLSNGFEGIIAKDLEAPYVAGARKFAWIKLKKSYGKSVDTADVVIVGYYEGKGHRAQFEFGGLLTAVYNENKEKFESIARIGSGFTEQQMVELKEELSKIEIKNKPLNLDSEIVPDHWVSLKHVITVAFDEITKSPMHTCAKTQGKGYALRFPRMIELRIDKDVYDVTSSKEITDMYDLQNGL